MTPSTRLLSRRARPRRGGFALLITITLLAFLVLLLVSLASLTRVETSVAGNNQKLLTARQNALAGLNIALGQLQRYAGPDQRVSARADVVGAGDGTARWTGVWGNQKAATDPASTPLLLNWLVSGNEAATFSADVSSGADFGRVAAAAGIVYRPSDAVVDLAAATSTALSETLTVKGQAAVLLAGPGSLGKTGAVGPLLVVAPVVPVRVPAASVPGFSGADITVGNYAWWVGDEGIKARVNLVDPYAPRTATGDGGLPAYAPSDAVARNRALSPQRSGIELVSKQPPGDAAVALGTAAWNVLDAAGGASADFRRDLGKLLAYETLPMLPGYAAGFGTDFLRYRNPDLTTQASGVLADPLRGGLKKDLTTLFNFGDAAVPAGYRAADLAFATSHIGPVAPTATAGLPTFGLLKSFYDLRGEASGLTAEVTVRAEVPGATMGVYPVITQASVAISASYYEAAPGVWRPRLHLWPLFALWNPCNARLKPADYTLEVRFTGTARVWWKTATGVTLVGQLDLSTLTAGSEGAQLRFGLGGLGFEPGEAILCTAATYAEYSAGTPAALVPRYNKFNNYYVNLTDLPNPIATEPDAADTVLVRADTAPPPAMAPAATNITFGAALHLTSSGARLNALPESPYRSLGGAAGEGRTLVDYAFQDTTSAPPGHIEVSQTTLGSTRRLAYIAVGATPIRGQYDEASVHRFIANHNHRAVNRSPAPTDGSTSFSLRSGTWSAHHHNGWPFIQSKPSSAAADFVSRAAGGWIYSTEFTGTQALMAPMFDLPRADFPFASLGLLQHAMLSDKYWHPSYIFGNSLADPRIKSEATGGAVFDGNNTDGNFTDWSYVMNRSLWDRFFLSTVPAGLTAPDLAAADFHLANSRLVFRPGHRPEIGDLRYGGASTDPFRRAASVLMLDGAFNVNSTSVEAWKALLASFNGVVPANADGATVDAGFKHPFGRFIAPPNGNVPTTAAANRETGWRRNRFLTDAEVEALAAAIVAEIRSRAAARGGPFLSLADFVNRSLVAGSTAPSLKGALQAAIDATAINARFATPVATASTVSSGAIINAHALGPTATGIPGFLTQADLLQSLGPVLAARSDTFVIRSYGDVANPATQLVEGKAWCEAVVQRLPDYVNPAADVAEVEPASLTDSANRTFGRRFQVIQFRWLTANDL